MRWGLRLAACGLRLARLLAAGPAGSWPACEQPVAVACGVLAFGLLVAGCWSLVKAWLGLALALCMALYYTILYCILAANLPIFA
jgi:hypothetical protein